MAKHRKGKVVSRKYTVPNNKKPAAVVTSKNNVSKKSLAKKEKKPSFITKFRVIDIRFFQRTCLLLLVAITGFFISLQGLVLEGGVATAIHYGYVLTVFAALLAPLVGFIAVKESRQA